MAPLSRFLINPAFVGLEDVVLTSRGDGSWSPSTPEPEGRTGQDPPGDVIALAPTVLAAASPLSVRLSSASPGLAMARLTSDPGDPGDPGGDGLSRGASIDLDAIDSRIHSGRCACAACSGSGRSPLARSGATPTGGSTSSASAIPTVSLQTLADYLTTGYWQEAGTYARKYNLTSSGTGAKSGVITYNLTGWTNDSNGLSADRQALAREIFKVYSAVLGVTFREVTGSGGDIRFTDNDSGAYAYMASGWYADATRTKVIINYSVVNVESAWYDGKSNYNTYTPQTFFHEVGHALGLGHQGQYNYTGTPLSYDTSAQFANDSWQATMMSYWDQAENPTTGASFAWLQTPMPVDWIALDDLYRSQGFSTDKAFLGDTVYGVGTNISAAVSQIWNLFSTYAGSTAYALVDGGGYDTLDVSNFAANQLINLAPSQPGSTAPSVSNIGGKIGNLSVAVGTIIEAANGGSGSDTFYGNAAANTFRGNGGDDGFYDSLGSDIYYGDSGNDWLYFSESIDLLSYSLSGDSLRFARRSGSVDVDQVWKGLENLSFNGTVYTYDQLLQSLSAPALPSVTIATANGTLASGAITNSTALSFSGSLSQALAADQSIAFYRDGVQVGTASAATGETTWSFATTESSGTSTRTYTAQVVTSGGQQGNLSNAFQLTIDTVAPVVGVNALETQDTTPLLSGSINDQAAQVSITIGAITRTAVNNGNGTWSLQWNDALTAGQTYNVIAQATDAAGNTGSDSSSGELIIRPDDFSADSSSTGLVSVGGSANGNLELKGDRDWFAVDLQVGRSYAFRLNGTTLSDPQLRLRNSSGGELASNDNSGGTLNALINFTATSGGRYYLDAGASSDNGAGTYSLTATDVTPTTPPSSPILYFSLATSITTSSPSVLGGLTANSNDIIAFDGTNFSIWLNGNASGLSGAVLRDFSIINSNEIAVAFQNPITLAGISFDDSDLARLTRTGNGFAISMLFDGSDVGLEASNAGEAIDAVTGLSDGSWLISTRGVGRVAVNGSNLNFAAEDLLQFRPTALGDATSGTWSLYADMSDVGLSTGTTLNENITAVDVAANGRLYLATQGSASATGLTAANEDIFVFQPTTLGGSTSGSFQSPLFFDGSVYGLGANAIQGLDVPV